MTQLTLKSVHVTIVLVLKQLCSSVLDLIYPPSCILCKKSIPAQDQTPLCPGCQMTIQRNRPPFCAKCSRSLENNSETCPTCSKNNPHFDTAWAAAAYDETMQKLIHLFKYGQKTSLQHCFFELISEFITAYRLNINQFDLVIPVPLHPTRLRERGYNQAQLLAQLIARQYSIPLSSNNLIRIRNTESQSVLSQKERWTNIQQAFRIRQPVEFQDKEILLIDDLLTTGATASEAARTLKEAGAKRVDVLTIAVTALES